MHKHSITSLSQDLAAGKVSSVEITQDYLKRINELDKTYNSFITVTADLALEQAKAADAQRASGKATALTGVPIAHKDLFCTQGVLTTCASKMLSNFTSPYSATVVEKLEQAGAVSLGKLNMDEFAMGSTNESSFYGPVNNPWDTSRIPGGSSGGSAAAVAAGLVAGATASDTGGSIRQPAAYCGLTGIKPTYGRVSRWGMVAYASSFDQAGVITQTAEDAALMLQQMAGFDEKDSTSMQLEVPDYRASLNNDLAGLTIGLPKEYFSADLNPDMAQAVMNAVKEYEKLGAKVKEISLPNTALAVPAYYIIAPAECSTNLSRLDGVRYGYRCDNPRDLHDLYVRSRSEAFGEEVKRRIMIGAHILSAGSYETYYRKAQQVRRLIKNDFISAFKEVDVIAGPVTTGPAYKRGEKINDPIAMYLEDIFTSPVNLAGLPALSHACGQINQLPVGLHLIGNYFDEARLLNMAHRFQQATDWHTHTAPGI
ncbi:MAG: Asp-tRNA(Asn)/Glu-tRNA(Gln) amidotransferase subunit GatA [Venatoribacter sp.]